MEKQQEQQPPYELAADDVSSPQELDYLKNEAAVVRKLDLFIAPIMMLLQLISYLDRGNIGFAATQGMTVDIHLKDTELNVGVSTQVSYAYS